MSDDDRLKQTVLDLRRSGLRYLQIAEQVGRSKDYVRLICKMAIRRGEVTAEELGVKPKKMPPKPSARPDYDKQWIARIIAKCEVNERGCWLWTGHTATNGYGSTGYASKNVILHRKMYELIAGKKPERWEYVCHHCDNKLCCNPAHLWLGSPLDNSRDELSKGRHPEQKVTHCPKGHPYDEANTYITPSGARNCKACSRERCRQRWHNNPEVRERQRQRRAAQRATEAA